MTTVPRTPACLAAAATALLALIQPPGCSAQEPADPSASQIRDIERTADSFHEAGLFEGVILVARGGVPLFQKAYGYADVERRVPHTLETRFDLASVAKQFTAAAVMLLVEEGRIELDAPVSRYLPEYRRDIGDLVTVEQLLNHTSCIPEETLYMMREQTDQPVSRARLLQLIAAQAPVLEPGTRFSYNNVNYILLSMIVESVSGTEYAEFLERRVFEPLGMEHTGFGADHGGEDAGPAERSARPYMRMLGEVQDAARVHDSWIRGAGALYSTAPDLLKWDQALHSNALLSQDATGRMHQPSDLANYGYGWSVRYYWVEGDKRMIVSHTGGGPGASTVIDRFLPDSLLMVVLSNWRHSQTGTLARRIGGILLGAPPRSPPGRYMEAKLQRVLFENGIEAAAVLWEASWDDPGRQTPTSGSLNRMGYQFLRTGRVEQALQVFRLYTHLYPSVANAWDSFAEAQLVAEHADSAVLYYRRAVDLDLERVNALFMLRELGDTGPADISHPVLRAALDGGVEAGLEAYSVAQPTGAAPHEFYVNVAAYNLLRHDRAEDALRLFQLNVALFPESANTWDSQGEAYMVLGRREEAIRSYRKSLELNPDNSNAERMLERLQAGG